MPRSLIQIVAFVLLLVQGLIGVAPGRVLCLPFADCKTHETAPTSGCGQCDSQGCEPDSLLCSDHRHTPLEYALHPHTDCGCHIHVPVPSDEQLPTNPPRADHAEHRWVAAPMAIAIILASDWSSPRFSCAIGPPPDLSMSDQVLSLKTTRLLI